MKISGFTFVKNAVIFDYPIVESIKSMLPLCDEVIVLIGDSTDGTHQLISSINDAKVKIFNSVWDENLRLGGKILAVETDKAMKLVSSDCDWLLYLQADEVIHEQDYENIRVSLEIAEKEDNIDGLLFNYKHFYGSYDFVCQSNKWYKNEIRMFKNNRNVFSYKDAQGFRKGNNSKLIVLNSSAKIYHYGWVKPPQKMQSKQLTFHKFWHNDEWVFSNIGTKKNYEYSTNEDLKKYSGTHPTFMTERVKLQNWDFNYKISSRKRKMKDRLKDALNFYFGIDLNYKNYLIFKP